MSEGARMSEQDLKLLEILVLKNGLSNVRKALSFYKPLYFFKWREDAPIDLATFYYRLLKEGLIDNFQNWYNFKEIFSGNEIGKSFSITEKGFIKGFNWKGGVNEALYLFHLLKNSDDPFIEPPTSDIYKVFISTFGFMNQKDFNPNIEDNLRKTLSDIAFAKKSIDSDKRDKIESLLDDIPR